MTHHLPVSLGAKKRASGRPPAKAKARKRGGKRKGAGKPRRRSLAPHGLHSYRPQTAFLSVWDTPTDKCDFLLASKSMT